MSQAQAAREALARQAVLVGATAQTLTEAGPSTLPEAVRQPVQTVVDQVPAQLDAVGAPWRPWPSDAPTDLPSTTPLPTPSPGADAASLLTQLSEGIDVATGAAVQADDAQQALAATSVAVAWAREARALASALGVDAPASARGALRGHEDQAAPATTSATDQATAPPGAVANADALVTAYDAARYVLEQVAARATDPAVRAHAVEDAARARQAAAALLSRAASPATDPRLAAYAWPSTDGAPLGDADAAARAWLTVVEQETAAGATGGQSAATCLQAALAADVAASAWGDLPNDPLPGLAGQDE